MDYRAIAIPAQAAVGPHRGHRGGRRLRPVPIKIDGVVPVCQHLLVSVQAVGDIGIGKDGTIPEGLQDPGMKRFRKLQELLQIDDLVVAPVSNVRPWIVRLRHFPLDAIASDPVGIVAIGGRGVQELGDHPLDVGREGVGQRFPILENITPVALIVQSG